MKIRKRALQKIETKEEKWLAGYRQTTLRIILKRLYPEFKHKSAFASE
jgi:hypothetical protein